MPLVSVVIPSYNHEKFVSQAIESVLGQDFDDLELIIVDDASTDTSRQIIQKYAVEDTRVRVILHETNNGVAKTINDGIAIAQGKFLAVTASDDVWMKDKLSKQLAVLESDEDQIVWTEAEIIDESGRPVGSTFSEFWSTAVAKQTGDIFHDLLGRWEDVIVLEYAMSQWHDRMSAKAKATALMRLAPRYYQLGQSRKALMCYCRAFVYDPFRRSNLQYPRRFLQFTRDVLRRGTLERT